MSEADHPAPDEQMHSWTIAVSETGRGREEPKAAAAERSDIEYRRQWRGVHEMSEMRNAVTEQDVIMILKYAKVFQALQRLNKADIAQGFLGTLWFDWRSQGHKDKGDLGHLFDMYFMTQGDFPRIEREMLAAIPEELRSGIEQEATEAATKLASRLQAHPPLVGMRTEKVQE